MFDNVGEKLKNFSVVWFVISAISAFITGLFLWVEWGDTEGFLMFLAIAVGGNLVTYIISLFMYAFGELVDNSSYIRDDLTFMRMRKDSKKSAQEEMPNGSVGNSGTVKKEARENEVICPKCGERQPKDRSVCLWCGESLAKEPTTVKENMKDAQTNSEQGIVVTEKDLVGETSMICPVCKSKQLANRKVCWQCGTKFIKETTE